MSRDKLAILLTAVLVLVKVIGMTGLSHGVVRNRDEKSTRIYIEKTPGESDKIVEPEILYKHGSDPVPVEEEIADTSGVTASSRKAWGCFSGLLKIILFVMILYVMMQLFFKYKRWRREKEFRNF
jgi:hypothetical protein